MAEKFDISTTFWNEGESDCGINREKLPFMIYYRLPFHLQKVFEKLKCYQSDFSVTENIMERFFYLFILI